MGHRSLYHDGWRAVCPCSGPSFTEAGKPSGGLISADTLTEMDAKGWELYHIDGKATRFLDSLDADVIILIPLSVTG
jgi:arylsulfatase